MQEMLQNVVFRVKIFAMNNKLQLTDSQIIDLLGGCTKVAKLCKVSVPAVSMWRKKGIPASQFVFLGATLERESNGLITRKDILPDSWHIVYPELLKAQVLVE